MHYPDIQNSIAELNPDKIFILTDSNVKDLPDSPALRLHHDLSAPLITIKAGEENKSLAAVEEVLAMLVKEGATRRSLMICVGGGMPTDLGGFAAAIFKRGIRHINLATTILGAVDAAVGGKTGVDFMGLKNEIGAFHLPVLSTFDASTFSTLPTEEILSGFGVIAKTALLSGRKMTDTVLATDPLQATANELDHLCRFCRDYKMKIVTEDPTETGLRKVLNLGHTAGHAIESYLIESGHHAPHGIMVAHGNLIELILSNMLLNLESKIITEYITWLIEYYHRIPLSCNDYEGIWQKAAHDKKNRTPGILNFTLLQPAPDSPLSDWQPVFDYPVDRTQLEAALDIYRDLLT